MDAARGIPNEDADVNVVKKEAALMASMRNRFEQKQELALRTYVVTNGDRNPTRYLAGPGVSLEEAVTEIVQNYDIMVRGEVEFHDLGIWRKGRLVAVSRRRQGKDSVTIFADE
jgi:hypothetical protein